MIATLHMAKFCETIILGMGKKKEKLGCVEALHYLGKVFKGQIKYLLLKAKLFTKKINKGGKYVYGVRKKKKEIEGSCKWVRKEKISKKKK